MSVDPGEGWLANPGFVPEIAKGRRVEVILANGEKAKGTWAADGKDGCDWSLRNYGFDIAYFRVK